MNRDTKRCPPCLIVAGVSILVCLAAAFWVLGAQAAVPADLPPLPVQATEAELTARGCRLLPADAPRQQTGTQLRAVVAADASGERLAWCPAQVIGQLAPVPAGSVAGVRALAAPDALADDSLSEKTYGALKEDLAKGWKNLTKSFPTMGGVLKAGAKGLGSLFLIGATLQALGDAAALILQFILGYLVMPLLQVGVFLRSPVVQKLWPIVLGVANAGFLIALLMIALMTVFNVAWGQTRKMLPKLFLGALLVNFSLVIAAAILDFTRVVMAALLLTLPAPAGLSGGEFLSRVLTAALGFDWLTGAVLALFMIVGLPFGATTSFVLGFIVLGVKLAALWIVLGLLLKLVYRYLLLLFLMVVSPLAYLTLAFPGKWAEKITSRWWDCFLRACLAGPAFLLLLLGAVHILNPTTGIIDAITASIAVLPGPFSSVPLIMRAVVNVAVFITLYIVVGMIGKKLLCGWKDFSLPKVPFVPFPLPLPGLPGLPRLPGVRGTTPPPTGGINPNPRYTPTNTQPRPRDVAVRRQRFAPGVATGAAAAGAAGVSATTAVAEPVQERDQIGRSLQTSLSQPALAAESTQIPRRTQRQAGVAGGAGAVIPAELDLRGTADATAPAQRELTAPEPTTLPRTTPTPVPMRPSTPAPMTPYQPGVPGRPAIPTTPPAEAPQLVPPSEIPGPDQAAPTIRPTEQPLPRLRPTVETPLAATDRTAAAEQAHARRLQEARSRVTGTPKLYGEGASLDSVAKTSPELRQRYLQTYQQNAPELADISPRANLPQAEAPTAPASGTAGGGVFKSDAMRQSLEGKITPAENAPTIRRSDATPGSSPTPRVAESFGTTTGDVFASSTPGPKAQDAGAQAGEPPAPGGGRPGGVGSQTTVTPGGGAAGGAGAGGQTPAGGPPEPRASAEGAPAGSAGTPKFTRSGVPQWVQDDINIKSEPYERNGMANKVEELAAKEYTAKQIADELGIPREDVSAIRVRRGIPSMNSGIGGGEGKTQEFLEWQRQKLSGTADSGAAKPGAGAAEGAGAGRGGAAGGEPAKAATAKDAAAASAGPEKTGIPADIEEMVQRDLAQDQQRAADMRRQILENTTGQAPGPAEQPRSATGEVVPAEPTAATEGAVPEGAAEGRGTADLFRERSPAYDARLRTHAMQEQFRFERDAQRLRAEADALATKANKGSQAARAQTAAEITSKRMQATNLERRAMIEDIASKSQGADPQAVRKALVTAEEAAAVQDLDAAQYRNRAQALRNAGGKANKALALELEQKAAGFDTAAKGVRQRALMDLVRQQPALQRQAPTLQKWAGLTEPGGAGSQPAGPLGETFAEAQVSQQGRARSQADAFRSGLEPAEGASGSRVGEAVGKTLDRGFKAASRSVEAVANVGKAITQSKAVQAARSGAARGGAGAGGLGLFGVVADDTAQLLTGKKLLPGKARKGAEVAAVGGAALTGLSSVGGAVAIGLPLLADQGYRLFNKRGEGFLEQQHRRMSETGELLGKVGTGSDPITKFAGSEPLTALEAAGGDFSGRAKRREMMRRESLTETQQKAFGELSDEEIAQRVQTNPAADPKYLGMPGIGEKLTRQQRLEIINYGTHEQKLAMLTNLEAVRNMSDTDRWIIENERLDTDDYKDESLRRLYNSMLGRVARGE